MSRPVTLVAWEDATKNPPEAGRVVLTDEGMARSWPSGRVWEFDVPDMEGPCEPTVWCDPSPPGPDALTVEKLEWLSTFLFHNDVTFSTKGAEAYGAFRRALDALGNGGAE